MDTCEECMDVQNMHNKHTNCQNTCDKHMNCQNVCHECMNGSNPRTTHSNNQSDEHASNTNTHNDETTSQTLQNTHNNRITWRNHSHDNPGGLFLDLVSPSKFDKIHQCRTAQFKFYIGGTDPCSPGSLKARNRIV